ncbi:beta-ribofuranosylaminobenzene 5'-phosphate synthase family protein [Thiorhodococcus minor]|uniref:GHMP kinase n=1 Tax=Thiorhodococcus minor TaxID=57489 RepID=A0A6M0K2L6_9GAMM|nr:beta-ribofuranosylaminobenzene 5'-phosphate synthase family protein [Thiorhodococcus minor]NEV63629.1 GHMP kinase [Thiorhodococcus minor]
MAVSSQQRTAPSDWVDVEAPARLHLGFLDLNGGLGRRFGSLGLTLDGLCTSVSAQRCERFSAEGPESQRALAFAEAFAKAEGLEGGARIRVHEAIPGHCGLGSGTQMALAVGTALDALSTSSSDSRAIARTLGRGRRSGIGICAFEDGGFVVDCGRGDQSQGEIPPLALRLPFPEAWRVLLIFDQRGQGLHGEPEVRAFAELPEFPETAAGHLCRLLLMQIVPGLLESALLPVAEGIAEIQRVVGDHFAPAQGGRFTSPAVAAALAWAEAQGFAGVGQSSWGPTGFVLTADAEQARWLEQGLKRRFGELSPLRYRLVRGRNAGAKVRRLEAPIQLRQEI